MFSYVQICSSKRQLLFSTLYFYAIYCNFCEACPPKCLCLWTGKINCEGQGLSEIPVELPANANVVMLARNSIDSINEDYFQNMQNVLEIHLQRNMIQEIPQNSFTQLSNLIVLNLRDNRITALPNEAFTGLNRLNRLDLRGNTIMEIREEAFRPLSNLEFLDLYGNSLRQLYADIFRDLRALKHLDLGTSKLIGISSPKVFHGLGNLTFLNLGKNSELATLTSGIFSELPSLKKLILQGCNLRQITPEMFNGLTALEELQLQDTGLRKTLPLRTFEKIPNLTKLRIDNNQLTSLHGSVISFLEASNGVVYLQQNNWQCSCGLLNIRARWPKFRPNFLYSTISCQKPFEWKAWDLWSIPLQDIQAKCLESMTNVQNLNLPKDSRVELKLDCPIQRTEGSVLDWITPGDNYISDSAISLDGKFLSDPKYTLFKNGTLQIIQADSGSYICSVTSASGESATRAYRVTFSDGLFGSPLSPEDSDHESSITAFVLPTSVILAVVAVIAVIVAWFRCRRAKEADDRPYNSPHRHHVPVKKTDHVYAYAYVSVPDGNNKKKRDISAYAINALFELQLPENVNTDKTNHGYDKLKGQRPKSHSCRERGSKYPAPVPVPRPSYTMGSSRVTSRAESCIYVTPGNSGGMSKFIPNRVAHSDPEMSIPIYGGASMIEEELGLTQLRELQSKSVSETKRPNSNPYLELLE